MSRRPAGVLREPRRRDEWPETEWAQADVESGPGLAEAVAGVDVILNAVTSPFKRTRQVDVDGARRLVERAKEAGVRHFLHVSIVGVERIPFPYYQHKVAGEKVVMEGGVPWSILRATQFHSLLDGLLLSFTRFPVALLDTHLKFQPIDAGETAAHLVACVERGPAGRLPDIGGPEVLRLGDMLKVWLKARDLKRLVLHLPLPGGFAHALRNGYNTCADRKFGKITWAEWVNTQHRQYLPEDRR